MHRTGEKVVERDLKRRFRVIRILVVCAFLTHAVGCVSDSLPETSDFERGQASAKEEIAQGNLILKEYPALPYPPGHNFYTDLLEQQCGVTYKAVKLPVGLEKEAFAEEVRGWNDVMESEVRRQHGADIFQRLKKEGTLLWEQSRSTGNTN